MNWHCITHTEAETDRLGELLADLLTPGTTVALVGNLGAGKTRLVKAIALAMGVPEQDVNSPTFVLIQEYAARVPLYHFDVHRLRDADEFLELGAEELLGSDGICLIEWADRVAEFLPGDSLRIDISAESATGRKWGFSGEGNRAETVISGLQNRWNPDSDH